MNRGQGPAAGSRGEGGGPFFGVSGQQRVSTGPQQAIAAGGDWLPELRECFEALGDRAGSSRGADSAAVARRRVSTLRYDRPGGRRRLGEQSADMSWPRRPSPRPNYAQMSFEVDGFSSSTLARQIEIAEQRVAEVLDSELARRLQTIPGVGPALGHFIAEIGTWRLKISTSWLLCRRSS